MDLDGYLEGLKEEGDLHSSGRFTRDLARQLAAYDRFNGADPGHGLARFVQAAVASGARRAFLGFSTYTWILKFHPLDLGELASVPGWACGREGRRSPAADHLLESWLSLGSRPDVTASLRCHDTHTFAQAQLDRSAAPVLKTERAARPPRQPECSLMISMRPRGLKQSLKLWAGAKSYRGAIEALLKRIRDCPIPVVINSRTPSFPEPAPNTTNWRLWRYGDSWRWTGFTEENPALPPPPVWTEETPARLGFRDSILGACVARIRWSRAMEAAPCRVYPVHDGVQLNPVFLDKIPGGYELFLSPSHCLTDASGLAWRVEQSRARAIAHGLLSSLGQASELVMMMLPRLRDVLTQLS